MLVISIFSYSHNVFNPIKDKKIVILTNLILLSAKAFNLDQFKILLFGLETL